MIADGDRSGDVPRTGPRLRRWWLPPLVVVALLAMGWVGGLLWFVHLVGQPMVPAPQTDGIIALTGGAGRVEAALRLLADHPRSRLLISGIGGATDLGMLAARAGVDPAPLAHQVTLGRAAISTRGNALEARSWVNDHRIRSLAVVTARFHMPRAMVELRGMLPDVKLFPHPIASMGPDGALREVSLRVLIGEYSKYLVAVTGLTGLAPARDQLRSGPASG